MKDYANLMMQNQEPPVPDRSETAVARIVQNLDGTRRLVPSSTADPTSPEFQQLLGPQGSLTTALGIQGVATPSPEPTSLLSADGCPTGPTGCNVDPFFHFPDLENDTANCLYIPTFTDVPLTISMVAYFVEAFLKEVNVDTLISEINKEVKTIVDDVVYGNILFNYLPVAILLVLILWVLVIHGTLDWKTGVFLTAIVITVLWFGFLLLDTATRGISGDVLSKSKNKAVETFGKKNETIICNLLKGYYAGVSHMILPEAALCKSPTPIDPCSCFDTGIGVTGFSGTIKIPVPSVLINGQIQAQGTKRCIGINNNDTLLPIIEGACPCIKDIDGFTLGNVSKDKKEDLLTCVVDTLPGATGATLADKIKMLGENCLAVPPNLGLCALVDSISVCTL